MGDASLATAYCNEGRNVETVKIKGKVEPACYSVSFDITPRVEYRIEDQDIDIHCEIGIANSDVLVTCRVSRWDSDVLTGIVRYIYEWAIAQVNLFTFATGKVLTVHLDRAELPDGSETQIAVDNPRLASLATACRVTDTTSGTQVDMREALTIVLQEPTLMLALNDLCSAINFGSNTLTDCARAVEGLRSALWVTSGTVVSSRNQEWGHFRSQLNLSQAYLQEITNPSRGPRHGSTSFVPGSSLNDVVQRSWIVMNRVLLYRIGGNVPLTAPEHPPL